MLLLLLKRIQNSIKLITTRKGPEEWQKTIFIVYVLC